MEHEELKENILEQIEDAINVIQLLTEELTATEEDSHIVGRQIDGDDKSRLFFHTTQN